MPRIQPESNAAETATLTAWMSHADIQTARGTIIPAPRTTQGSLRASGTKVRRTRGATPLAELIAATAKLSSSEQAALASAEEAKR